MQYLIDGNNVVHSSPQLLGGPPIARAYLCRLTAAWAAQSDAQATIVFDGHSPPDVELDQMRFAGLRVEFAGSVSADEVIEDYIEEARSPANLHVVTSDRAIQSAARRRRCPCHEAVAFLKLLLTRPGEQAATPSEERPVLDPLTCPKCGQGRIIEGRRGFGCNRYREGCDFVVWKELSGKRLTEKQIRALIGKGKTRLIKGFKGRSGSKFDARLRLDEQRQVVFDFPERKRSSTG